MSNATFLERLDRFAPNRPEDGCWEWQGCRSPKGYGLVGWKGKRSIRAHRWAYEQLVGPIPDGMILRHKVCDNPPCVNPAHMLPGTHADNKQDSIERGRAKFYPVNTHCKHGHEFTEENTYRWAGNNSRQCRACNRERDKARRMARKPTTTTDEGTSDAP